MSVGINEQKFYDALSDLFVGAKIEGQGGYVNLMKIKSHYFKLVLQKFKKEVDNDPLLQDSFREEFFDKLYDFFKRYFSETGSVFFVKTSPYQKIYERIYSPDKDVALFWKTHMLYYVKSDILFKSMEVEISDEKLGIFKFYFDVGELEGKKNNEKRQLVFTFKELKRDNENNIPTIVLSVQYSQGGKKTNINNILKAIKQTDNTLRINDEIIEKAIRVFKKQSEVDFFINKDAKKFLREQLDLYLHQLLLTEENIFSQRRLDQIKTIQKYALKIIDFISQFEDELVKIWNKPKFALNANYVITLDRLKPEIIRKIAKHPNLKEQIKEWQQLGIVDKDFKFEQVFEDNLLGNTLSEKYKHLPIDTKYFKDLELEILEQFDNLDEALDGRLIKSENYQALITLLPKYREKVQTIYIDPPYNTGSDGFPYKDSYKHSSWLTMMENRLKIARGLLEEDGVIFVSIDDHEVNNLTALLNTIFEESNKITTFCWEKTHHFGRQKKNFWTNRDFIICYAKELYSSSGELKNLLVENIKTELEDAPLYNASNSPIELTFPPGSVKFNIPDGTYKKSTDEKYTLLQPVTIKQGRNINPLKLKFRSRWSQKRIIEELRKGTTFWVKSRKFAIRAIYAKENTFSIIAPKQIIYTNPNIPFCTKDRFGNKVGTNEEASEELKRLFGSTLYSYPKPVSLVMYLISLNAKNKNIYILDFFAGSGTTAHAVLKLNKEDNGKRKFLLIDMAEYFYTVMIPRLKKIAYSFNWKDGNPQDNDGTSLFFKYYELEQYEDTLRKAKYKDYEGDTLFDDSDNIFSHYIFFGDEKLAFEDVIKQDENGNIHLNFDNLYPNIDWPETLSNLLGLPIKKIKKGSVVLQDGNKEKEIKFDFENMTNEEKIEFLRLIKPLIWWGE